MSEVALATTPLTAPPVIRALLAKLAISYTEVAEQPGLNPAQKVQAVLLEDAVGALMVLFHRASCSTSTASPNSPGVASRRYHRIASSACWASTT
jgi:hypothetical protein